MQGLLRHPLAHLGQFFKILVSGAHQCLQFHGIAIGGSFGHIAYLSYHEGFCLYHIEQHCPMETFHQHTDAVSRQVEHLLHPRNSTHPVQIAVLGIIHIRIPLRHKKDQLIIHHGFFQSSNTLGTTHIKVHHHVREYHQTPKGQQWQRSAKCSATRFLHMYLQTPARQA